MKSLRLIALILVISISLSLVSACGDPEFNENDDENSSLNIFNFGVVCVQDDWIYYGTDVPP